MLLDVDDPSLAPEQLLEPTPRAHAVGPWTDVCGLATLAHLAIAGRLPPPARRREACLSRPSLVSFAGERWDAAMLRAIDRALSPVPASRPRVPGESPLTHMLDRPASMSTSAPTPSAVETPAPAVDRPAATRAVPPRSPAAWQILIVVLSAVLATTAIWASARPSADGSPRVGQRPSEMPVSAAVRSKG